MTALREIALADPAVTGLGTVLTMHLGPEEVLLNIEVEFKPGLPVEDIHAAIRRIETAISLPFPQATRVFIEVSLPAECSRSARGHYLHGEDACAPSAAPRLPRRCTRPFVALSSWNSETDPPARRCRPSR